jgi:hypothetical protein
MKGKVERLHDESEWEQFVSGSLQATFYHTLKWKKVLEEAFSLETEYLVVRGDSGKLIGVCPFAVTRKLKVFRILDSLPESDFGGPLVAGHEEEALLALNDRLFTIGREKGITYAKIRCPEEKIASFFQAKGKTLDLSSGSMNLNLTQKPPEYIWDNVFTQRSGQRTYIRRFEKDGFQNVEAQSIKDLDTFYDLYQRNMSYIGGAPHPYSFFRKLWEELYPDYFNILLTTGNGRCIGGEGFFIYPPRKTAYQTFIGLDRNVETQYRTYFYLSWGLIQWCTRNGFRVVSFGGTPSDPRSSNYSQKSKFGGSFNQDYVVCLPFDHTRFLAREVTLKLGRAVQNRLPASLRSRMQRAGFGI